MKTKRNKYKVTTSTSVMSETEINSLYKEGWELLQIVHNSVNNFTHIFKYKKLWRRLYEKVL
jgi:hypothetical protein